MLRWRDLACRAVLGLATVIYSAASPPMSVLLAADDGLLTASKIATLKLAADWVVLSACNTAASDDTPDAGGFSSLAKAFFYTGARALLVSNWSVPSAATVKLITGTFDALKKAPCDRARGSVTPGRIGDAGSAKPA